MMGLNLLFNYKVVADFMIIQPNLYSKGFVKINRSIQLWEWATNPTMFYFWIRLLLKANWKDEQYEGMTIPRGSMVTSRRLLAIEFKLTEKQVRNCLDKLKERREIRTKMAGKMAILTICNYEDYQDSSEPEGQPKGQPKGQQEVKRDIEYNKDRDNNNLFNNIYNQENNIYKQEEEKKEIPPLSPQKGKGYSQDVERLYAIYPTKCPMRNSATHKGEKCKAKLKSLLTERSVGELEYIIKRYVEETYGKHYLKDFLSFLNNLPDYSEPEKPEEPKTDWRESKKYFNKADFDEHPDDYNQMEIDMKRHLLRGGFVVFKDNQWTISK